MIYDKQRNECPFCKMPGNIRDIDVLTEKFRDRIPLRVHRNDGVVIRHTRRYRTLISILFGLICILFIFYAYMITQSQMEPSEYDNVTIWDDYQMG